MQSLAHAYESHIPLEDVIPSRHVVLSRLNGFGASPGIAEGPCTIIRNLQDLRTLPYGAIVACEVALPTVAPLMPLLGGLIAERGGSLSIASRYAREYGIPAVFGVEGLMGVIRNGDVLRVDGSMGIVDIIGASG